MIDIATHGGIIHNVNMKYDVMKMIIGDNFIKDHNFIEFQFSDGAHGSVRKDCIEFYYESEEQEEPNNGSIND